MTALNVKVTPKVYLRPYSLNLSPKFFSDSILGFQVMLHYPRRLLYSVLIHKILLVAYADTLEA
jgi:hypothetical protein